MTQEQDVRKLWDDAAEGMKFLEAFIGTIKGCFFELASTFFEQPDRASTDRDQTLCILEFDVEQAIDPADWSFPDTRIPYSVGKAATWQIIDQGARVVPSPGTRMGNSKYQKLIARVTRDLKVPINERRDAAGGLLTPYDSQVWTGLRFQMETVREPLSASFLQQLKDRGETPASDTTSVQLPSAWLQDQLPPLA